MERTLVIYHGECFDGFTAAWAARRYFMSRDISVEFFPVTYPAAGKETELPDCEGRDVYMLDFCVSREQLEHVANEAAAFRVLDHHKTHQDACSGLPYVEFDMERSGAAMAWDHFHQGKQRPWLVDYVQDRDLWQWRLPSSKAINAYIMCQEMTWESWDRMLDLTVDQAEMLGRGAEMYLQRYVRDMQKVARRMAFPKGPATGGEQLDPPNLGTLPGDGYHEDIPVVNAPYLGTSELVGALAESALFAVGWFQRADGLYQYSFRSRGDFDVSELAKRFGGGGHANAAGLTVPTRIHG